MLDTQSSDVDVVPHLEAVLSLYEMSDDQLLARRSKLLGELMRALAPEERAWLLDIVNVVYLAGCRDGAGGVPARAERSERAEEAARADRSS